jgi:homotetrameric cytidine deaminase
MKSSPKERALIDAAVQARGRAHAPYSRFKVGAALVLRDGTVVTGVNVENASYGLTVCAERNAIAAAVNAGAAVGDVSLVAVAAESETPTPPCGACRQVLAEFLKPAAVVLLHNTRDGKTQRTSMAELLPNAFLSKSLPPA